MEALKLPAAIYLIGIWLMSSISKGVIEDMCFDSTPS